MIGRLEPPYVVPLKDREPYIFLEYGALSADSHAFIFSNKKGVFDLPAAMFAAILIQPGVTVTHEAIRLASEQKTLLMWVGEESVRLYSAGLMDAARSAAQITKQVNVASNETLRVISAKLLYRMMFGDVPRCNSSVDQLRGKEGAKVRQIYKQLPSSHGIEWKNRNEAPKPLQQCLGMATSCLYAICEAVIWMSGYHPSIGIVQRGAPNSLACGLADTVKFKTVIPLAFERYATGVEEPFTEITHACRDYFKKEKVVETLFVNLENLFDVDYYKYQEPAV